MDVDVQRDSSANAPVPFEGLWFPDGNIILATDMYLFKVHRGILSLQSSVFRDMLELPVVDGEQSNRNDAGMAPEMYEGLPLVKLADEKGEGLTYLLRAVYQRQYYHRDNNNTPLEVVTSLLLLSTKYDFKHIRTDVILQISKHYPMNLRDYCAMDFDKSKLFGRTREGCHFPLLHAAVTADVDILLPVLYYAASDFSMTAILDHHGDALGIECLKILLKGREKLDCQISALVARLPRRLRDDANRINCRPCSAGVPTLYLEHLVNTLDLKDVQGQRVLQLCHAQLCPSCASAFAQVVDIEREEIWRSVPDCFGSQGWDVLRMKLEEMLSDEGF